MADKLTEQQVAEYKDAFSRYDKNGDGTISHEELSSALKALGKKRTKAQLKAMIKKVDADGSGTINFSEFCKMNASSVMDKGRVDEYRVAFRFFDKDGNGFISPAEFGQAMAKMGDKLTDAELKEMVSGVDVDGDGRVNYSEFIKWMSK